MKVQIHKADHTIDIVDISNEEFIEQHKSDDIRSLALKKMPEGINAEWCLQQIEGMQIAEKKMPKWRNTQGIWYPVKISLEQCSSQEAAEYKQNIVKRLLPHYPQRELIIDLSGGIGMDFWAMANVFKKAIYTERNSELCRLAQHNFPLLGLNHAEIKCTENKPEDIDNYPQASLIYIDPARRSNTGKKVVALEDCSPNVVEMQNAWKARYVMIKLSPMLDITQALRQLKNVEEVHIVSVKGECKELLLIINNTTSFNEKTFWCTNLPRTNSFTCKESERNIIPILGIPTASDYLFEPGASLLKGNCQEAFAKENNLVKIHPISNLYIAKDRNLELNKNGRLFSIEKIGDFSKQSLKLLLDQTKQANLTIRNFPTSVADLRKKLKIKEGGDIYFFATTLSNGTHALIKCRKV